MCLTPSCINTLALSLALSLLAGCVTLDAPIVDDNSQQAPTPVAAPPSTAPVSTDLKPDETVILFPTNAQFDTKRKQWEIPIHGWVFEPEHDSSWRNGLIRSLRAFLDIDKNSPDYAVFQQRTRMFLVDNEGDKAIALQVGAQHVQAHKSGANGHFATSTLLTPAANTCRDWLTVRVITPQDDNRDFSGQVQCVAPQGVSVISDIDDTIKQSNVLDKKELLKNTFLREFSAVPGMADIYQSWSAQGYAFHYVSSSPWQLYPALATFLQTAGYPRGSMHLKLVRLKDSSIFNLFDSPEEGKLPAITELMQRYPQRRFILVGDSGEKDPEIYASIAQRYPQQVSKIFIRRLPAHRMDLTPRFAGLARDKWQVFDSATEIAASLAHH